MSTTNASLELIRQRHPRSAKVEPPNLAPEECLESSAMHKESTSNETDHINSVSDGIFRDDDPNLPTLQEKNNVTLGQTFAGIAGNVLEWYDFAVFGFFGDIIGDVCFPKDDNGEDAATIKAFAVFGLAFLMRPIGGVFFGYIGDVYGRRLALMTSLFLMAFPTFAMGLLPSYDRVGVWSIVLLITVRLLQGLSVGGQIMSSLVFTLESKPRAVWGLYGSFVFAAANFGTLLGGIVGFTLRETLTEQQLRSWGWRLPFLSGIIVALCGCYLREHNGAHGHVEVPTSEDVDDRDEDKQIEVTQRPKVVRNPLRLAFARKNLRSLAASAMVPMLWSGGFYLTFVWMAIYMSDLIEPPIPGATGVTSAALFISVCLFFPFAGFLSDRIGRMRVMIAGGSLIIVLSPIVVHLIASSHDPLIAFLSLSAMGVAVSCWGAPMCAWLVESFEPQARLTSVAIGYNLAQAAVGSTGPAVATALAERVGPYSPGWMLTTLGIISLSALLFVAPKNKEASQVPADLSANKKGGDNENTTLEGIDEIDEDNELL